MRIALVVLSVLLFVSDVGIGQETPCVFPRADLVNARVNAKITQAAGRFQYHYRIENMLGAQQILDSFAIEAFATAGGNVTQLHLPGWRVGGRIADTPFHAWSVRGAASALEAGSSVTGFGFLDADLPAIARFLAWGKVESPAFPRGQAPESCENTDVIPYSFKGSTIGPRPPQSSFVPIEFLNYLITLVQDSRKLGWIRNDGVRTSLLAKLINAKRQLERGQTISAKNILNAFLQEVQAASCPEFSCPGNRPLTSEAYALLFFSGQFLVERLR